WSCPDLQHQLTPSSSSNGQSVSLDRNTFRIVGIPARIRAFSQSPTTLLARFPVLGSVLEATTLFVLTAFFLFYGLVPIFGGAGLGLVGADAPRYAQAARAMLPRPAYT